jgi:hypothetical protein
MPNPFAKLDQKQYEVLKEAASICRALMLVNEADFHWAGSTAYFVEKLAEKYKPSSPSKLTPARKGK